MAIIQSPIRDMGEETKLMGGEKKEFPREVPKENITRMKKMWT